MLMTLSCNKRAFSSQNAPKDEDASPDISDPTVTKVSIVKHRYKKYSPCQVCFVIQDYDIRNIRV